MTKTKEFVLYPAYALSGLAACIMLWISVPRQNEENNIIAEVSQNHASIVSANDDLVDSDDLSFFTDHYDTLDEFVLSEALNLYAGDANPDNEFPSLHPEIENELFDFIVKESNEQEM